MRSFQVMRESFRDASGEFSTGVVWLWDVRRNELLIGWLPGFDVHGQLILDCMSRNQAEGFSITAIWSYWASIAAQRGYTSVRSAPETVSGETPQDALQAVLQDIVNG
jgi:hypothetical protein